MKKKTLENIFNFIRGSLLALAFFICFAIPFVANTILLKLIISYILALILSYFLSK